MTEFTALGLAEPLLRALKDEGYSEATPIQARTIPALMDGRDVQGIAQTGTGKTAAFALPILQHLLETGGRPKPKSCRVLVLAPTRELAQQIADSFRVYGRHMKFSSTVVVGGVKYGPQIKGLSRGVDVLIATPGRLIDHMESRHVSLRETEIVVLDEADHMLDLGFLVPIKRIVKELPQQRQNVFFSATMPKQIGELAGGMLRNPERVSVTPVATTAEKVAQQVYFIEKTRKRDLLAELLGKPEFSRTLVFTRTKRGADRVSKGLSQAGIASDAIHGDKSQGQRQRALASFKDGKIGVLIATDIAARGIDVDSVSHVVNFDLPEVPEAYVHRIGRTARGGASGIAISFCDNEERSLLRSIEKTTRQTLPVEDMRHDKSEPERAEAPKRGRGGRPGGPKKFGKPAAGQKSRKPPQRGPRRKAA
ncbi:DEAD/DEAH box helicase [Tepidicaulis sp. LMO-SS28]|uniref:DEAD/DEAH box helicase n=1 Tax=Tepidicaulis sp. LMO-SS28 TaxID=3447455 RepID=UPI003EDEBC5A